MTRFAARISRFRLGVALCALIVPGATWAQCATTTAAGTTINQTGTSGVDRIGARFFGVDIGSLMADLSGSITARGTGLQLLPVNGNANVPIRSAASFAILVARSGWAHRNATSAPQPRAARCIYR